ncbi:hypothetical protein J4573_33420 [Actinomadura barringtoniae]|uniref:Uncharacterized protein n=1 Tax=Actinomadura barringtoniae TaxID=1427535 RepID=A0A939PL19_9ACTN|nr:hypothetical protein [Actinomadura barringtoniae]MBO2452028.1 hypothetical protein [Actinomadura barringtoniae]
MFFLGIAMVHFLTLPDGFHIEPYIGVSLIIALMMALFGAGALLVEDRDRVWWYALAEGLLNGFGYVLSRVQGLPLTSGQGVSGGWFRATGMALAFFGFLLAALAGWILISRRLRRRNRYFPITSAFQRRLAPPPRAKHPAE